MVHTPSLEKARTATTRTNTDPPTGELDHATTVLASAWPHLCAIANRTVDDANRADDVVRDAWRRWQRANRTVLTGPKTFLAATTTRLAVSVIKSARRRPQAPTSRPHHGEQVEAGVDPEHDAERTEAAELAVFLLRENLSPAELAAYVLRKAFDCPYPQISKILQRGVTSPSYLVLRAAECLAAGRCQPAKPAANRQLMRAFLAASRSGSLADLGDLLAADLADHPTRWPIGRKR